MPAKLGSKAFSVLNLLRKAPSQTPRPDVLLFSFGRLLGTPSWWDFSDSASFDSLLDYHGNIQVELWVRGEQVEVRRVGVRMWTAISGVTDKAREDEIRGQALCSIRWLRTRIVGGSVDIPEEVAVADASETVVRLGLQNKIEMHFFIMGGRPALAEIQAYSDHRGA